MQKANKPNIGLDIMGCESSPDTLLTSLYALLQKNECPFTITVFCTEPLAAACKKLPRPIPVDFVTTSSSVEMNENPLKALRTKRDATMYVGLNAVREKQVDALITCGNTGALIAGSYRYLDPLQGIRRPALVALMPTKKTPVAVLDVGANVTCDSKMLYQFALMGRAFQMARGIDAPRIGILNIGEEESKGRPEFREVYSLLEKSSSSLSFIGNIEGRCAFDGNVDVLITDGFTGNVFLKTAEGVSSFLVDQAEELTSDTSLLTQLKRISDYEEYPGALLSGVDGLVIKCHGASNGRAVANAIMGTHQLLAKNFITSVQKCLAIEDV